MKFIAVRMDDPNVQMQIPNGWTPIELAAQGLHSEIVSYITELQDIHSQWSNTRSEGNEIHVLHGNPWSWNFSKYYAPYSCLVLSCTHLFYWVWLMDSKDLEPSFLDDSCIVISIAATLIDFSVDVLFS